ncbi:MAG: preprotein translocase subunit SecA [Candidatus Vogelbacteria bacterium]|nr:preprotein translocase subunit SecA [Candidatus Vogelbacteria bacterium]
MSILSRFFGNDSSRYLKNIAPLVAKINLLEPPLADLPDQAFPEKTNGLKARLAAGSTLDDLLPEAFALVREAARRTLGERHFDVQLLGGVILHQGRIAEMKTGEGKTLVATLAVYLNALDGEGVHVVTVNDYLARRDAVWMGQIYDLLGLSVGVINNQKSYLYDASQAESGADQRRDAAGAFQVVYEFLRPGSRREAYAADITYGSNNEFGFDYLRDHLAYRPEDMVQRKHQFAIIDEVDSVLIDEARTPLIISAPVAPSGSLYKSFARLAETLKPEADYTVDEKHKAAVITESGIAKAEQQLGLSNIYTDLGIKYVHHLETAVRAKALFLRDRDYVVRGGEVVIVDEFTGRLQPGRRWSDGLHQAIEAKEGVAVKEESRTYASITLQNYFKLYQKLAGMTGTAATSAEEFRKVYGLEVVAVPTHRPGARTDLTDLVFQTEAGKYRAVVAKIKELQARGQPVLVGTISIEKNEALSIYLRQAGVPHRLLNAKNHEEEGAIIAEAGRAGSVVIATNMAGRGVDIKLGGPAVDGASAAAYEKVKGLGGLFVLGTERHEARRIDNQLRGRAGRQGDPGMTQFFLSFEDTLTRVFVSEKVKNMIKRFGLPEAEPIEHRLVARAIESAQKKIEGINFDLRRHLLEYDNVLNHQRAAIYGRREQILFGERQALGELLKDYEPPPAVTTEDLRRIMLGALDALWVEHLEAMEYLKQGVNLRAYGQRDPFVEYKREGLRLFKSMEATMIETISGSVKQMLEGGTGKTLEAKIETPIRPPTTVVPGKKIGRNDPCPCGSGRKYKKCHGVAASQS